jgi:hypothetical protein
MKRLIASFALLAVLSGCALFKYTSIEYNNFVANEINESSHLFEDSGDIYAVSIPDDVTELDEIDTVEMTKIYNQMSKSVKEVEALLGLQSKNIDQEQASKAAIQTYLSAGNSYLESYSKMLAFYTEGTYLQEITRVQEFDADLSTHYNTFLEANNDIVDILEEFVQAEAS